MRYELDWGGSGGNGVATGRSPATAAGCAGEINRPNRHGTLTRQPAAIGSAFRHSDLTARCGRSGLMRRGAAGGKRGAVIPFALEALDFGGHPDDGEEEAKQNE